LIDLTINTNQLINILAIVAYVIIISIAINKYHQSLSKIKKEDARFRLQFVSKNEAQNTIKLELQRIKKLKKISYLFMLLFGFLHLIICIIINTNLLSSGITFLLFIFILIVNYWLKGSSVSSSIKNIPGQSDYHG
jgi:hypothetical protein